MSDNNEKIRVTLSVAGCELTLVTTESKEQVLLLANELDNCINNILNSKPGASVLDAVVLTALTNLDKMKKENQSTENLRTQVREYANEANKATLELSDARREIERLKNDIKHMSGIR